MTRARCVAVAAALTMLVLAGCGGGGDDAASDAATTTAAGASGASEGTEASDGPEAADGEPSTGVIDPTSVCELVEGHEMEAAVGAPLTANPSVEQIVGGFFCRYVFGSATVVPGDSFGSASLAPDAGVVQSDSGLVEVFLSDPPAEDDDATTEQQALGRGLAAVPDREGVFADPVRGDVVVLGGDRHVVVRVLGGIVGWSGPGTLCAADPTVEGCTNAVPTAILPGGPGDEVLLSVVDLVTTALRG